MSATTRPAFLEVDEERFVPYEEVLDSPALASQALKHLPKRPMGFEERKRLRSKLQNVASE